jgi:hypothetical protein
VFVIFAEEGSKTRTFPSRRSLRYVPGVGLLFFTGGLGRSDDRRNGHAEILLATRPISHACTAPPISAVCRLSRSFPGLPKDGRLKQPLQLAPTTPLLPQHSRRLPHSSPCPFRCVSPDDRPAHIAWAMCLGVRVFALREGLLHNSVSVTVSHPCWRPSRSQASPSFGTSPSAPVNVMLNLRGFGSVEQHADFSSEPIVRLTSSPSTPILDSAAAAKAPSTEASPATLRAAPPSSPRTQQLHPFGAAPVAGGAPAGAHPHPLHLAAPPSSVAGPAGWHGWISPGGRGSGHPGRRYFAAPVRASVTPAAAPTAPTSALLYLSSSTGSLLSRSTAQASGAGVAALDADDEPRLCVP